MPAYTSGQRVQTHPATDAWMSGDRYGYVSHTTPDGVEVNLDSGRAAQFHPDDLLPVVGSVTEPPRDSPGYYVIQAGNLCYLETERDGLVPVKVTRVYETGTTASPRINVNVRVTSARGEWHKGERETMRHPVAGLYKREQVTFTTPRSVNAFRSRQYTVEGQVRFYTEAGRLLP